MIVCPACRHNNPETARACENCGRSLEGFIYRTCPACGALNPAQSAFCRRCLNELLPVSKEPASEQEDDTLAPGAAQQRTENQGSEPSQPSERTTDEPTQPSLGQQPAPLPVPLPRESTPPQDEDALEGIDEPLPLPPAMMGFHEAAPATLQEPSEAEQFGAALFREVAEARAPLHEPIRLFPSRRSLRLPPGGRALLYLLVLAAAAVPFFSRGESSAWIQPRSSVISFARTLYELPEDAVVLVSFDYTPTFAGEMDTLALALLRHLANRSVGMVVMSTKPAGVGLAQQLLGIIQAEHPEYRYGQDYLLLGYLPGEEIGLRTLNSSLATAFRADYVQKSALSDLPITRDLNTIGDLDAIVLLADDSHTVRQWIEQVQSRGNVFMYAAVTSAIEPLLLPYQQSGQLDNLIGGIEQIAEYEVVSGVQPVALGLLDGYVALFVLVVAVALATNIVFLVRREWHRDGDA